MGIGGNLFRMVLDSGKKRGLDWILVILVILVIGGKSVFGD
jgi:hypothetical protein|tara:strand:+ start:921 stop:1043 length:123 start_codon:yes stop_codon:yes gene_type:complete